MSAAEIPGDRAGWLDLNRRTMEACFASFAESSGGEVVRRDGVFAMVTPATPERSLFNSVVVADGQGLRNAYEELERLYAEHGCAWTVWVREDDAESAALLGGRGHVLDAEPRAMGLELDGFEEPDLDGIDWTGDGDHATACELNDRAYGYAPGTWMRGTGPDPEGFRVYLARLDGRPAASVAARSALGDCSIWDVATDAEARGRGLATALMRRALFDGAGEGCRTSSLQATRLGAPIYGRIGYRDHGALQMWERRQSGVKQAAAR